MTNSYHATSYDISAAGFYFKDFEEYTAKAAAHRNEYGEPVEEYEIQFIDGDNYKLFGELNVSQANLEQWFDDFEELDGDEAIKAIYLAEDLHCTMDDLLDKLEDVMLFEGTAEEYVDQYLEDCGILDQIPEQLQYYFDSKAYARDMLINGDITELSIDNTDYIVWGC